MAGFLVQKAVSIDPSEFKAGMTPGQYHIQLLQGFLCCNMSKHEDCEIHMPPLLKE
jgi:hypothetical protein